MLTTMLPIITKAAITAFVVGCLLRVGLTVGWQSVVASLKSCRVVGGGLIANFVVIPAVAVGVTRMIPLPPSEAIGLILLGTVAGAPFLPKLVELAKGDVALSAGVLCLQTFGTVAIAPVLLPLLTPTLNASSWMLARTLVVLVLLPLGAGLLLNHLRKNWAQRVQGPVGMFTNASLLIALVLLIWSNFSALGGALHGRALAAICLFVAASMAIGFVISPPGLPNRSTLGLAAAQRNVAAAVVIAAESSDRGGTTAIVLAATFVGLLVMAIPIGVLRTLALANQQPTS